MNNIPDGVGYHYEVDGSSLKSNPVIKRSATIKRDINPSEKNPFNAYTYEQAKDHYYQFINGHWQDLGENQGHLGTALQDTNITDDLNTILEKLKGLVNGESKAA
jgi:hypothetical protein